MSQKQAENIQLQISVWSLCKFKFKFKFKFKNKFKFKIELLLNVNITLNRLNDCKRMIYNRAVKRFLRLEEDNSGLSDSNLFGNP